MSMFKDSAVLSKMLPAAAGGSHTNAGALPPVPPLLLEPDEDADPEDEPDVDDDDATLPELLPEAPDPPAPPDDCGVDSPHASPATEKARSVVHADVLDHLFIRLHLQCIEKTFDFIYASLRPKLHLRPASAGQIAVFKMNEFNDALIAR